MLFMVIIFVVEIVVGHFRKYSKVVTAYVAGNCG